MQDHQGADGNYEGGQTLPLNRSYPALRSPVSGVVTRAGEGGYGTIAIQDKDGVSHQLLHTHSQHVRVGDAVMAGELVGTMGNMGVDRPGVEGGDFHLHYQIKDRHGRTLNPVDYWNEQGPIDPDPYLAPYLNEQHQYDRQVASTVDSVFGKIPTSGPRYGARPVDASRSNADAPALPSSPTSPTRILRSRRAVERVVDAPATTPNELAAPGYVPSFADRFGGWTSEAGTSAPITPDRRFVPPPTSGQPQGLIAGAPGADYPFPPPSAGESMPGFEDWAALRRKSPNWSK
ncbi:M23 family metallopeptidase [Bradyrhizobium sp. STM 3809]|uniref:M23 family metallopeptidase n=1 Tax=Bradyrhizobium sp. STM 3809 TaxID=551936 RepID=UPI001478F270|nr:M23 family metallopeptidase [Bradyrhizobium sp. STM 3809]